MKSLAASLERAGACYTLRGARVPASLAPAALAGRDYAYVDVAVEGGRLRALEPAGTLQWGTVLDVDGRQVWPAFHDLHTHLDKTHTLTRAPNADGTLLGAVKAVMADHARWRTDELEARADFALRCAWAHGTAGLRTHLDAAGPQAEMAWDAMLALRARWAPRVRLQMVAMAPMETYLGDGAEAFVRRVADTGGVLGGVTRVPGLPPQAARQRLGQALDALFDWAVRYGLDVDLHVDESCDPEADSLLEVARRSQARGVGSRVVCGHCCSLAVQSDAIRERVLDACRDAGLAIVSLPLVNLFLQDRASGRTPRLRGLPPLQEIQARGIPTALSSDNCADAFHAYGDYDMLEVFREAARSGHLDRDIGRWPASVTATPAARMRDGAAGRLEQGAPADFLIFEARTMPELLARPQADRQVVREGRPLAAALPSFRELDAVLARGGEA